MKCMVGISDKIIKTEFIIFKHPENVGKCSMYKRCICEMSLCVIKFKSFKMMSLIQNNQVIMTYSMMMH